jgi:hypothetical protein
MQKILIDGRQFSLQHLIQYRNHLRIAFHDSPRGISFSTQQSAECQVLKL